MTEVNREVVIATLKEFIVRESGLGETAKIDAQTRLLEAGVLDSLMIMTIIAYCEEAFNCSFDPDELEEKDFETLTALADQVCLKLDKAKVG
jgi:acyl carrier protein